ncbi:radical SAM protein [Yinghuangia soli]|uniref:Radical SAM protein n=1 Tax=Yinghuangia soli TaxID=2908204 RepID=A0AA41PW97_9ACTN|nr:radical SAM protein [Yinghuangia soli]MCF2527048.1 radical SAM protein [Yinghuangia soli]
MTVILEGPGRAPQGERRFRGGLLELDLTRKCALNCTHCYNGSGPEGTHGEMTRADWLHAVEQAGHRGFTAVQLIGGEPTMHPDAPELVAHALTLGMTVEVFTNLVHVTPAWWALFRRPGVSLATSYYSADADAHNEVTRRPSHPRTEANIITALRHGIPLRVGLIRINVDQDVNGAVAHLRDLGVTDVRVDDERPFGRAGGSTDPAGLCGRCGDGRAAIGPNGDVSPCVMSAWLPVGNVRSAPLSATLDGDRMAEAIATIREARAGNEPLPPPGPQPPPPPCSPQDDECSPGTPLSTCNPRR